MSRHLANDLEEAYHRILEGFGEGGDYDRIVRSGAGRAATVVCGRSDCWGR